MDDGGNWFDVGGSGYDGGGSGFDGGGSGFVDGGSGFVGRDLTVAHVGSHMEKISLSEALRADTGRSVPTPWLI